jgi:hypothetical protein
MGAYNIVNPSNLIAGQPEDVSVVLANLQAIQAVLNGGIDNSNLSVTANIALSKLLGYPSDGVQVPARAFHVPSPVGTCTPSDG